MSDYDPEWGQGRRPHVDGAADWNEAAEWARIKESENKLKVRDVRRRQVLVHGDYVHLTETYHGMKEHTRGLVVCRAFRKTHVFVNFDIGKRTRCISVPKEMLFKVTYPANF